MLECPPTAREHVTRAIVITGLRYSLLLVLLAAIAAGAPVCAADTMQCGRFSQEELPAPVPSLYPSARERLEQISHAIKSTSYSVLFFGD